jgi:hypothetical protein
MKRKHQKTLDLIEGLNPGVHWTKVEALLRSMASAVHEKGGSSVTFVIDGRLFAVDRPHPRKECGLGLVKRVRERLREIGAA